MPQTSGSTIVVQYQKPPSVDVSEFSYACQVCRKITPLQKALIIAAAR